MPTHAHGQGYSDINFMIPELVDRIEYRKGTPTTRKKATSRPPVRWMSPTSAHWIILS